MSTRKFIIVLGLLAGVLAGCQAQPTEDPQMEEVQQRLESIETRLGELGTGLVESEGKGQAFQVIMANHILDTAGLHEIDESINGEGVIGPEFPGNVSRVLVVLAGTDWPEPLHEGLEALQVTLAELEEALSADDVEAAGPLATQAHEQQHDFSHEVGEWLAENVPGMEAGEDDH